VTTQVARNLTAVPLELQRRPQWVVWKIVQRDGKATKLPYQFSGEPAAVDDPRTWGTFDEALRAAAADGFAGIGYVFTADDPYTGVDLDKVRNSESGALTAEAQSIVERLASYTEITQSECGLHVIVEARKPGARCRTRNIEMYDDERFFVMTGAHLAGTPATIEDRQDEINLLYGELFPPPSQSSQEATPPEHVELDDEELLQKMFASKNGDKIKRLWDGDTSNHGDDHSEADAALCAHLAWWTNREATRMDAFFRQCGLFRSKWDSRRGDSTWGAQTIAHAIARTPDGYRVPRRQRAGAYAISASSIEAEEVTFLDARKSIPLRAVTVLYGPVGLGKSQETCRLAAANPGVTLMATAEDALSSVLRPRLEAAGADLNRVYFIKMRRDGEEDGLVLPDDVDQLDALIDQYGANLIIIDPLTAHLSAKINSWSDQSIRTALAPLHRLAEKYTGAVIAVLHTNKQKGDDPMMRIGGSVGIGGAARSALLLARDPGDPEGVKGNRRVLAHTKSNYGQLQESRAMLIQPSQVTGKNGVVIATSKIVDNGPSDLTGQDLLQSSDNTGKERKADTAIAFLAAELSDGKPHAKPDIVREAKLIGISERTLERAMKSLNVQVKFEGLGNKRGTTSYWSLPQRGATAYPEEQF